MAIAFPSITLLIRISQQRSHLGRQLTGGGSLPHHSRPLDKLRQGKRGQLKYRLQTRN